MHDIKAITFDLDDSLWAILPVLLRAEQKMHAHFEEHYPRITEHHDIESVRALRVQVGESHPHLAHDFTAMRHLTYVTLLEDFGYDKAHADLLLDRFMDLRHEVELFDDVLPALEQLAGRYRLLSLSNGNASLERIGLDRYFHGHVNPRIAGVGKPDPRIFHTACELLDLDPGEVLHIGDHPVEDIQGAMSAGLKAAWLNRTGAEWPLAITPHYTCTSLLDLTEALAA